MASTSQSPSARSAPTYQVGSYGEPLVPAGVAPAVTSGSNFQYSHPPGPVAPVPVAKKRLNELDWFRALMVMCVVYAHVFRSGVHGGMSEEKSVDNRIYTPDNPNSFATRWISEVRQYCLPLLFYVSGAAAACAFKRRPKGFSKILVVTIVGMGLNALLWLSGPQNPECDPGTSHGKPECQGPLLSFTVCPWSGNIFPIVFQMWYTVVLVLLMLLNWPLFAFVRSGLCGIPGLVLQWAMTSCLIIGLIVLDGAEIQSPVLLAALMLIYEAIFLAASLFTLPAWRPSWLPLRSVHYVMGLAMLLQFGATPIVPSIGGISAAFALYIFVGFNKSFQLGFVLTLARLPGFDEASPIVSNYWPMLIVLRTITVPSTNWMAAGNLTYPYYPRLSDRTNYVAGAILVMFVFDRVGRFVPCRPLPAVIINTSLLSYLLHPWLMALLISATRGNGPFKEAVWIWAGCLVLSFLLALALSYGSKACKRKDNGEKEGTSSDSESGSQDDDVP